MTAMVNEEAASAFDFIVEQHFENASFQWILLQHAFTQPHYFNEDILELKQRISQNLEGLFKNPELAWQLCEDTFDLADRGEFFTSCILAFKSNENAKIERVVNLANSDTTLVPAICSALGWLDNDTCEYWLKQFFLSKVLEHKIIALEVCAHTGRPAQEQIKRFLNRDDCVQHVPLMCSCIRLIGKSKMHSFTPHIEALLAHDDDNIKFYSAWSLCLLGIPSGLEALTEYALTEGPYQSPAIELVFRFLPQAAARRYISQMAEAGPSRSVLKAAAALGDPQIVNWLLGIMQDDQWARAAAETLNHITGIEIEAEGLTKDAPEGLEFGPNDDPSNDNTRFDDDENLPWPDHSKIATYWEQANSHFQKGERYFLGGRLEPSYLQQILASGSQRQRISAALHLASSAKEQALIDVCF